MNSHPGEEPISEDKTEAPKLASNFSEPTAEMKRKSFITGLLFFALFLVFLSISLWRKFV